MKLQKLLSFALLLGVFIINSGAGCSSKTDDPQPDKFQSLIGKWKLQSFEYNVTKQDGSTFVDRVETKARGIVAYYEYFSDGRLELTGDGKTIQARWSLKVTKVESTDIFGSLTVTGPTEWKDLAKELGQSGDLTYDIRTSAQAGLPDLMILSIDVTSQGPYKKNILSYSFLKQ